MANTKAENTISTNYSRIFVRYSTAGDLRAQWEEARTKGATLLPVRSPPRHLTALERLTLTVQAPDIQADIEVELLQILEGLGIVVRVLDLGILDPPSLPMLGTGSPTLPTVRFENSTETPSSHSCPEKRAPERTHDSAVGSSALSWSVDKLTAEWDNLGTAERIRVARYGNRGARGVVLRSNDRTIFSHLLTNPHISTEEIASLAGNAALDPAALRRIAMSTDWLRSAEVVRNLVCNPKLPMPEVQRLIRLLSRDELVRLAKSGRARASVKQAVAKRLKASER
ncbi:MAG TPA: hypothetical protein PLJ27_15295 [Polyangiaceae bacterium]|nr:hypothetical protein [Polyangiaceae bacterium]